VSPSQHEVGSGVADPTEQRQDANQFAGACEWVEQAVVFHLGNQRYGIPIDHVKEIQQIVAFSDVPSDGVGVVGMVNLRGDVIPAIDVRRLVGMDELAYTLETPMIITRSGPHVVALIVDEVEDVVRLPDGCLQAASPMHALSSRIIGVCRLDDGLVYLLDVDRLLAQGLLGEEPEDG
jgi:purine-binding chemotaxis protein CheW